MTRARMLVLAASLLSGGCGSAGTDGTAPSSADGGALLSAAVDQHELEAETGCWSYAKTATSTMKRPQGKIFQSSSLTQRVPANHFFSAIHWQLDPGIRRSAHGIYAHPLAASILSSGLTFQQFDKPSVSQVDYAFRLVPIDPNGSAEQAQHDLLVGVEGLSAEPVLSAFGDFSATAEWTDGSRKLSATLVEGGPYVYFGVEGGSLVVTLNPARACSFFGQAGSMLGVTVGGRSYGLFAPSGASFAPSSDGRSVTSTLDGKGYFAVAALPSEDVLDFFRRHAYAHVVGSTADWAYDAARSEVRTTFRAVVAAKESGGDLSPLPLLGLFPHQWKHSAAQTTAHTYSTARGTLKIIEDVGFETVLTYHGVLPFLPLSDTLDRTRLSTYLQEPADTASTFSDSYYGPISAAKQTEQALLADQAGDTGLRDRLLTSARLGVENWFEWHPGDTASFYYDPDFSTMIGYPANFGSDTFGNDHHYHWGYLLHAAAQIALYNPGWATDAGFGGMVKLLVRDVSSPLRNDAMFPFRRYFDAYAGHSWSSGSCNFLDGCNQESASEALNLASSLLLWGEATDNRSLRDLGVYLYTTEADAVEQYWFNADRDVFPVDFAHPSAVANVWGSGGAYATWFGAVPAWIHGINFLPVQGGSLWLDNRTDALAANYAHMLSQRMPDGSAPPANAWIDILLETRAFFDAAGALHDFDALPTGYAVETGETRAHTYAWITSLAALGSIDPDATADTSLYGVFRDGTGLTYVAFNPSCDTPKTVHFSDGATFNVPARSLIVSGGPNANKTVTLGGSPDCSAKPPVCPAL